MKLSRLQDGLEQLDIAYTSSQIAQLQAYLQLLQKWNRTYNLTAITDVNRMVAYHLLDSLAIIKYIPVRAHCLDVGTGAGLPGLPLAIMRADSNWILLDSNGKKTRFVQQAIAESGISNVKVVQSRVEDYHADSKLDVIVSRAYASLQDFASSINHLWQPNTQVLSMKTEPDDMELQLIRARHYNVEINRLQVPGIAEERCLVTLKR